MTDHQERWARVGTLVRQRMGEISLNQADLVRKSGVSDATVRPVMRGTPGNYRAVKLQQISEALGWSPDSIDRVLEGGEPQRWTPENDPDHVFMQRIAQAMVDEVSEAAKFLSTESLLYVAAVEAWLHAWERLASDIELNPDFHEMVYFLERLPSIEEYGDAAELSVRKSLMHYQSTELRTAAEHGLGDDAREAEPRKIQAPEEQE